MRLYPKKLRNINDLEKEKKLLQKEARRMEEDGFLSMDTLFSKKNGKEENFSLLDFLPVSNPAVDILVKLIKQRFSAKEDHSKAGAANSKEKKQGNNPLKVIAFEVIGGYLKWKAISLSFKGIKYILKKRKEKQAAD